MATRTLENKNDRLLTMLIAPFMSCSARLPVYVLLISAFFPAQQGLVLFLIYTIGIIVAVIVAMVMKKVAFAKKEVPFVMELPPYRIPTLKNTTLHMWHKGREYLKKMGTVILVASILIWALGYFPQNISYSRDYDREIISLNCNPELDGTTRNEQVTQLKILKESERQEQSYIGKLGHAIEPVIEPLGYDWRMGVSLLTGLAAKEVVVSTMGVLYNVDIESNETSATLIANLQNQVHQSGKFKGQKVFNPLVALSFMLFILIYFPCIAVIAAIKKEANWGWAIFTMFYTTGLAWLVAFAVYQIGNLLI
jgi:ferrous iron transport protein B